MQSLTFIAVPEDRSTARLRSCRCSGCVPCLIKVCPRRAARLSGRRARHRRRRRRRADGGVRGRRTPPPLSPPRTRARPAWRAAGTRARHRAATPPPSGMDEPRALWTTTTTTWSRTQIPIAVTGRSGPSLWAGRIGERHDDGHRAVTRAAEIWGARPEGVQDGDDGTRPAPIAATGRPSPCWTPSSWCWRGQAGVWRSGSARGRGMWW